MGYVNDHWICSALRRRRICFLLPKKEKKLKVWPKNFPEILTNPNCDCRKNQAMFKPFCISFLGYTSFRTFFANCTFLFPNKTKVLLGCKSKFRGPLERWVLRCWLSIFKFSNLYFKIDIFVKNIANNLLCWLIYH